MLLLIGKALAFPPLCWRKKKLVGFNLFEISLFITKKLAIIHYILNSREEAAAAACQGDKRASDAFPSLSLFLRTRAW